MPYTESEGETVRQIQRERERQRDLSEGLESN